MVVMTDESNCEKDVDEYMDFYSSKFGLMIAARQFMTSQGTWTKFLAEAKLMLRQHKDSSDGVFRPQFILATGRKRRSAAI
jgi:hypothetical protein